jgi:hypothetical protein
VDGQQFDVIAKTLSWGSSRRGMLRILATTAIGAAIWEIKANTGLAQVRPNQKCIDDAAVGKNGAQCGKKSRCVGQLCVHASDQCLADALVLAVNKGDWGAAARKLTQCDLGNRALRTLKKFAADACYKNPVMGCELCLLAGVPGYYEQGGVCVVA